MSYRYGGFSFEEEVVEGSTDQIKATVWFNNKGYHSLPSFYSGLSNGILRSRVHMMNKDPVDYGRWISFVNYHMFWLTHLRFSILYAKSDET